MGFPTGLLKHVKLLLSTNGYYICSESRKAWEASIKNEEVQNFGKKKKKREDIYKYLQYCIVMLPYKLDGYLSRIL